MACISIDWLQISVKINNKLLFDNSHSISGLFEIQKKDLRHNIFSKHLEIFSSITGSAERIAVFSYQPLSRILPEDVGHLKILNKFLYQDPDNLKRMVVTILRELELKFHQVSRLDIAYDFKKFKGNRSVQSFFKAVASGKLLKQKATSLHIDGKTTRNLDIHYMRFGSNRSPLQFYVYNKSKELRDKTDKPYIRDKWVVNGCSDEHKDTFRIEFVLHPSKHSVVNVQDWSIVDFNSVAIIDHHFITNLFWSLMKQHFVFVLNDGQVKKSRMKEAVLFSGKATETVYLRVTEKETSNRVDKMLIKKMYLLDRAWRQEHPDRQQLTLEDAITTQLDRKDLSYWFHEKMTVPDSNSSI